MADRGLEALIMLLLVIIVASLPLIPGQPVRLLGAEVLGSGIITLLALLPLQRGYLQSAEAPYRRASARMVLCNRLSVAVIALGGGVLLWRGDLQGLYLLPVGILMNFTAVGANAWVLLIEINR
jgi:hypothetical protein